MIARLLFAAVPLFALVPATASAQESAPAVSVEQMRRHIDILASDAFEGRKPGTQGETKTLRYIADQFGAIGLEPAANGSWFQAVPLVERKPFAHRAIWSGDGGPIAFAQGDLVLLGTQPRESLSQAPVLFVGYGLPAQMEGIDPRGAIALILSDAPEELGAPDYAERAKALTEAGAAAVIAIMGDDVPWSALQSYYGRGQTRLADDPRAPITGAMPLAAGDRLVGAGGGELASAGAAGFKPVRLGLSGSLDVSTQVRPYESHNVIGRLKGSGDTGESLLYLGHWDHLGICRPDDAEDRICNGAVDNASGIAMLIEIAREIAAGPRPARDLLFMGTTAEEIGLLGAEYFGAHPVVPIESLVAAINIDTVAISPAGESVAIVGRGTTPLDPLVDATARELGRAVDSDEEANAFVQRQDGWALTRAGVPTVMVGGSFANMKILGAFLSGPYHKPEDDLERPLVLEGAAEDTELLIALGRKLADPSQYDPEPESAAR